MRFSTIDDFSIWGSNDEMHEPVFSKPVRIQTHGTEMTLMDTYLSALDPRKPTTGTAPCPGSGTLA